MEKKPAHFAILEEVDKCLNLKKEGRTRDGVGVVLQFSSIGGATALLDLLEVIEIPQKNLPQVLAGLETLRQKHRHCVILSAIEKLTPFTLL